jgi:hypothetical protein
MSRVLPTCRSARDFLNHTLLRKVEVFAYVQRVTPFPIHVVVP